MTVDNFQRHVIYILQQRSNSKAGLIRGGGEGGGGGTGNRGQLSTLLLCQL